MDFCSHVLQYLSLSGMMDGSLKVRPMCLPDFFIEHGSPNDQLELAGLTHRHVASTALSLLGKERDSLAVLEPGQPSVGLEGRGGIA